MNSVHFHCLLIFSIRASHGFKRIVLRGLSITFSPVLGFRTCLRDWGKINILLYPIAIRQQTAVAVSNTTWLPPLSASLPKVWIVTNKRVTNTSMGTSESKGEGILLGVWSIIIYMLMNYLPAKIRKIMYILISWISLSQWQIIQINKIDKIPTVFDLILVLNEPFFRLNPIKSPFNWNVKE